MPYDPGVSYRGDQYLFQGISNLGQNLGAGISEFRKKREDTQQKLAFADSIMEHAHSQGRVSEEEWNKYLNTSATGKHSIAMGTMSNIAADFQREQFNKNLEMDKARLAQTLQIAQMGEGGANARQQAALAQANLHYLGSQATGERRATEALAMHEDTIRSLEDRAAENIIAEKEMAQMRLDKANFGGGMTVVPPAPGAEKYGPVPMISTSTGQMQPHPAYIAQLQAGKKTGADDPRKQMDLLGKEIKKTTGGDIFEWANTETTVGEDGIRRGTYIDAEGKQKKIAANETDYQKYVAQFEALQRAGAGPAQTGSITREQLARMALIDPNVSQEDYKKAREILRLP